MQHDIRKWMRLVETIGQYPPFIDNIFDAVNAAQVGFYFEEGGCFGMALALYERFLAMGYPAELMVSFRAGQPDVPSHAFVRSGGKNFDYTGVMLESVTDARSFTPDQFLKVVEIAGRGDEVMSDKDEADSIIDEAVTWKGDETDEED